MTERDTAGGFNRPKTSKLLAHQRGKRSNVRIADKFATDQRVDLEEQAVTH
jgi:hypothetical protein